MYYTLKFYCKDRVIKDELCIDILFLSNETCREIDI